MTLVEFKDLVCSVEDIMSVRFYDKNFNDFNDEGAEITFRRPVKIGTMFELLYTVHLRKSEVNVWEQYFKSFGGLIIYKDHA